VAQGGRAKLRKIAQGAWGDSSEQSPLAKDAYDAYIVVMRKMGLL